MQDSNERPPLNLMYDVSVLGLSFVDNRAKTGVYRFVTELLKELKKFDNLEIQYSHTEFPLHIEKTEKFLSEKISTQRRYKLPLSLFGRGGRFFKKFYRIFNINLNEIEYHEESFKEADIFHSPFKKIPEKVKAYNHLERVITVHDIIPIKFPQYHSMKSQMEEMIRSIGDDYAICISEQTRNDLLEYDKNIPEENVFVSHLAADPQKFYRCQNEEKIRAAKEKYQLSDNYFLSLCTLEPRKNLIRLIRCFLRFIEQQNVNDLKLVLVGAKGWDFDDIFGEILRSEKNRDKIIFTGWVPDDDLAAIYTNAHSFYYISLYEGFGLPPLESMQCGVATVTSNVSSIPEVVGDAALMVDPKDEDEICEAMHKLYTNSTLKNELVTKGFQRAKKFSWEKTAKRFFDIYHEILNNR